jgi:putative copper resistance protein D
VIDLLIVSRVLHFASTATVSGAVLFQWMVAEPAFRNLGVESASVRAQHRDTELFVWLGLAFTVVSGALWLVVLATNIGGEVSLVLIATGFGRVWIARLVLAALVLLCVMLQRLPPTGENWSIAPGAIAGAGLMGSLAWSGHAAGTPGIVGDVHRWADVLHLVAAAAWLGGLLPLWLLLRRDIRNDDGPAILAKAAATRRFSTLGIIAVGTLLATGSVNTWILVGGPTALLETRYGLLLLLKVTLFVTMVAIAAYNRGALTPRLAEAVARHQLARNALAETGLGLAILMIVSVLGVLPPLSHMGMPGH